MNRVGRAIVLHELLERARDRWVVVISVLFGLLATGVSLYGASTDATANMTGPSLVTLASLLVPLVAVVLGHDAIVGERERNTLGVLLSLPVTPLTVILAKFIGRLVAMMAAVGIGLGAAILVAGEGQGGALAELIMPCWLLGAAFLSIGILVSTFVRRQVTATSMVVAIWFIFVMFYDLGLLGVLVATDGQVSAETIAAATYANPAGLFRVTMMEAFAGPEAMANLGLHLSGPSTGAVIALWTAWVVAPLGLSAALLNWRKVQ